MDKELEKDFQQRPVWIFITVFILLIQTSPSFADLVVDFAPNWINYKKWINLFFIIFMLLLFMGLYWLDKPKHRDPDNMSKDESIEKSIRKVKWLTWKQNIFKHYPLNITTLRIIPLFICWIISQFIDKKHKPYLFDSFEFPKYWKNYNYEEVTSKFFKSMFRVYIGGLEQSYEIKFERDFQCVELRWSDKDKNTFNEPKNELYEKVFSINNLKHIKIFTWIFPFGLYWNLRRVIKNLFSKRKDLKN